MTNQLSLNFDEARALGAAAGAFSDRPRAFGPIYHAMARQGLIKLVGHTRRRKGPGAFGATIYALPSQVI